MSSIFINYYYIHIYVYMNLMIILHKMYSFKNVLGRLMKYDFDLFQFNRKRLV